MRGIARLLLSAIIAFTASMVLFPAQAATPKRVQSLHMSGNAQHARAVFGLSGPVQYKVFQLSHPDRVVLDFSDARLGAAFRDPGSDDLMKDVRTGRHGRHGLRVVLDMKASVQPKSFLLKPSHGRGYRLVLDMYAPSAAVPVVRRTVPTGERKVVVVVDPGHGGRDSGARGPDGLMEKTVTLAIGKRLARLINHQPGMRALLTRKTDVYIPLEQRFEFAREHKADLFVSIHANSCPDHCDARGASVWVLSTHGKVSEAGKWLARSENASDDLIGGVSLHRRNHTLAAVLLDLSQGASMHASKMVGHDVLGSLGHISRLYKPKVQHANFVVLRSPDVPSILVETAFISNRHDEHLLSEPSYRQKLADAIMVGIRRYFRTTPPPGTWFAAQWARKHGEQVAATGESHAHGHAHADKIEMERHRVTSGETLSGLAHRYGVSIDAIKSANDMDSNMLRAGRMLNIPAS